MDSRLYRLIALTRTLTTLYSMTLLSMLLHIQLNILGRRKYVLNVIQMAHDERQREILKDTSSLFTLLWGFDKDEVYKKEDIHHLPSVTEEQERKFLTLSWWLLHVGWKDVGERVRRAVEEVFEEYVSHSKSFPCVA